MKFSQTALYKSLIYSKLKIIYPTVRSTISALIGKQMALQIYLLHMLGPLFCVAN